MRSCTRLPKLGLAAITVFDGLGDQIQPPRRGPDLEALSYGCPSGSSVHGITQHVRRNDQLLGSPAQREHWLPRLVGMETLASYCLTEPGSGSDAAALRTSAVSGGHEIVLNGTKSFISGAGASGLYLVMARTGGEGPKGVSTILVEKDTPRSFLRRSGT